MLFGHAAAVVLDSGNHVVAFEPRPHAHHPAHRHCIARGQDQVEEDPNQLGSRAARRGQQWQLRFDAHLRTRRGVRVLRLRSLELPARGLHRRVDHRSQIQRA